MLNENPFPARSNVYLLFLESLEQLPPGLLRAVDTLGDRLVKKAPQLVSNQTTNLCENFMSIRSKMDGGKFFNRIQSGSFSHRSMAAALRIQCGSKWITHVWNSLFNSVGEILDKYSNRRKRKHQFDSARKVLQKYKKQRLITKLNKSAKDNSAYGDTPAEPDIEEDELKRLCAEYVNRLEVTEQQQQDIAIRTVHQANDPTGEWKRQRHGRITASLFGKICRRKASFAPLTINFLYCKLRETAAMRYGILHEEEARQSYIRHLKLGHSDASVTMTGIHIDIKVQNIATVLIILLSLQDCWLGASPDGLVYDPTANDPHGVLEIKCPASAKETSLEELSKSSSFFLHKTGNEYHLKKNNIYYYQVQGQMHVTQRTWCDFVVWTPRDSEMVIERIEYKPEFWGEMYLKLQTFYFNSMLPELASPRYPSCKHVRNNFTNN